MAQTIEVRAERQGVDFGSAATAKHEVYDLIYRPRPRAGELRLGSAQGSGGGVWWPAGRPQ